MTQVKTDAGVQKEIEPQEVLKDPKFIQYMYSEYQKQKRVDKARADIMDIAQDLKTMSKDKFKEKYGNPSREWALRQWELIKAKKGMHDAFDTQKRRDSKEIQ